MEQAHNIRLPTLGWNISGDFLSGTSGLQVLGRERTVIEMELHSVHSPKQPFFFPGEELISVVRRSVVILGGLQIPPGNWQDLVLHPTAAAATATNNKIIRVDEIKHDACKVGGPRAPLLVLFICTSHTTISLQELFQKNVDKIK